MPIGNIEHWLQEDGNKLCLQDILNMEQKQENLLTCACLNEDGLEETRIFTIKLQSLIFEHKPHRIVTLHEVTKLY